MKNEYIPPLWHDRLERALTAWNLVAAVAMLIPIWLIYRLGKLPLTEREFDEGLGMIVIHTAVVWVPHAGTVALSVWRYDAGPWLLVALAPTIATLVYAAVSWLS